MDGVLIIDKPEGLTSHDVVSAARRLLGEKRIGHTGTLDPLASGVLPLACGRATRLVRFLTTSDKDYDATILFGVTTDTMDVTGSETSRSGLVPSRERLEEVLASFRGEFLQVPPAFSAKKVAGRRAYEFARRNEPLELAPVSVKVTMLQLTEFEDDRCRIDLTCSSGFYVRALARDIGVRCGTGACLETLRRTRSGPFTLAEAIPLDAIAKRTDRSTQEVRPATGVASIEPSVIPLEKLLPEVPAVTVTNEGLARVSHGQQIRREDLVGPPPAPGAAWIRLLDTSGLLVGMAIPQQGEGVLHPEVVLI